MDDVKLSDSTTSPGWDWVFWGAGVVVNVLTPATYEPDDLDHRQLSPGLRLERPGDF
ncbi:MAG: hypothetical protein M3Y49_07490 [Actinomycetota bacterium]|nr:hypothetical protein [Actinomycetota bacterium]